MLIKKQYLRKGKVAIGVALTMLVLVTAGCGSQQATKPQQAVAVKATQVIQKDTPIPYEYVGQIQAVDQVDVKANVSGRIMEKMVQGGDQVTAGQPLFRIDSRQYRANLLNAQAQVAQAQAALGNARQDAERYRILAEQDAIAQKTYDNAASAADQDAALVDAYQAKVQQAQDDMEDTVVVSPITGKINLNDLSVGNYVTAGNTVFGTITSTGAVKVVFNMSENEYLKLAQSGQGANGAWGQQLKLVLSNGTTYPYTGQVSQIDHGLGAQTGTLSIKAVFQNPEGLLVPGMFTRVVSTGETKPGAILVPKRAVQEMLGKNFITVVVDGDKAESRPVTLGPVIGNLQVIDTGLTPQDIVVVEGANKTQPGAALAVQMVGPDDDNAPVVQ